MERQLVVACFMVVLLIDSRQIKPKLTINRHHPNNAVAAAIGTYLKLGFTKSLQENA